MDDLFQLTCNFVLELGKNILKVLKATEELRRNVFPQYFWPFHNDSECFNSTEKFAEVAITSEFILCLNDAERNVNFFTRFPLHYLITSFTKSFAREIEQKLFLTFRREN